MNDARPIRYDPGEQFEHPPEPEPIRDILDGANYANCFGSIKQAVAKLIEASERLNKQLNPHEYN